MDCPHCRKPQFLSGFAANLGGDACACDKGNNAMALVGTPYFSVSHAQAEPMLGESPVSLPLSSADFSAAVKAYTPYTPYSGRPPVLGLPSHYTAYGGMPPVFGASGPTPGASLEPSVPLMATPLVATPRPPHPGDRSRRQDAMAVISALATLTTSSPTPVVVHGAPSTGPRGDGRYEQHRTAHDPSHRGEDIAEQSVLWHHMNVLRGARARAHQADPVTTYPDPTMPARVRYLRHEHERAPFRVSFNKETGLLLYRGKPMMTEGARRVLSTRSQNRVHDERNRIDEAFTPGFDGRDKFLDFHSRTQDKEAAARHYRQGGAVNAHTVMGDVTNRFIYVMSVDGELYAADMSAEYKNGGVFDQAEFRVAVNNTFAMAQKLMQERSRFNVPALGDTEAKRSPFYQKPKVARQVVEGFHHTSFLAGADIACAGEIEVWKGTVTAITNASGHYMPPAVCLTSLLHLLEANGVQTDKLRIEVMTGSIFQKTPPMVGREGLLAYLKTLEKPPVVVDAATGAVSTPTATPPITVTPSVEEVVKEVMASSSYTHYTSYGGRR